MTGRSFCSLNPTQVEMHNMQYTDAATPDELATFLASYPQARMMKVLLVDLI